MELLKGSFTRPRQVRYQAALRPDTFRLFDSSPTFPYEMRNNSSMSKAMQQNAARSFTAT